MAIALNYSVNDIRNDKRQIYNKYILIHELVCNIESIVQVGEVFL